MSALDLLRAWTLPDHADRIVALRQCARALGVVFHGGNGDHGLLRLCAAALIERERSAAA